jgi:hypothetical protein
VLTGFGVELSQGLCRAILTHDDVAIMVDIGGCGGYRGCCGVRGVIVCGARGPTVGGLLALV